MEIVAVDVVGPLPHSDSDNRYVLSAMDYYLQNGERRMQSQTRRQRAYTVTRGGTLSPRCLPPCVSGWAIHKTRTTPLQPQSDKLVERFHCTLGQQLAILTSQHQ